MKINYLFHQIYRIPMKLIFSSIIMILLCTIQPGSATIFYQNGTDIPGAHLVEILNNASNISTNPFPIHFFYNTHCGTCKSAVKFIDNFTVNHPDVGVEYHDLYNNTDSFSLYEEMEKQYNRTDLHYPVIFIGNVGIMGSEDIETYSELLTFWYQKSSTEDQGPEIWSWLKNLFRNRSP